MSKGLLKNKEDVIISYEQGNSIKDIWKNRGKQTKSKPAICLRTFSYPFFHRAEGALVSK